LSQNKLFRLELCIRLVGNFVSPYMLHANVVFATITIMLSKPVDRCENSMYNCRLVDECVMDTWSNAMRLFCNNHWIFWAACCVFDVIWN